MKRSLILAGLFFYSSFTAAAIDINDPGTFLIDGVVNWEISTDTTYTYQNIYIAETAELNIFGNSLHPTLGLEASDAIEIYGSISLQAASLSLLSGQSISIASSALINTDSSLILTSGMDELVLSPDNAGQINVSGSGIQLAVTPGTISLVPIPASFWLMLPALGFLLQGAKRKKA